MLTEFWQNPAGPAPLGMIFPAEMTPFQRQNWGIIITFDNIGYVSDEDANDYDSNKLLNKMRRDIAEESKLRVAEGHSAVRLMGWAEPPITTSPVENYTGVKCCIMVTYKSMVSISHVA